MHLSTKILYLEYLRAQKELIISLREDGYNDDQIEMMLYFSESEIEDEQPSHEFIRTH